MNDLDNIQDEFDQNLSGDIQSSDVEETKTAIVNYLLALKKDTDFMDEINHLTFQYTSRYRRN